MVKKPVAKKKAAAKKTTKPVKFLIPVPHDCAPPPDCPIPDEAIIEPVHLDAPPMPLAAPLDSVDCVIAINKTFWAGVEYVVIAPVAGCKFPEGLETGRVAKVTFAPPG